MGRIALLAAGLLGLAGAVGAQPIEDLSPAAIQRQVEPGHAIRARVKDGRAFELTVVDVEATYLRGTTADRRRFRIPYASLTSLEILPATRASIVQLPPARASAITAWLGLGVGLVGGDVDVPCSDPSATGCSEGGFFTSFGANVTVAGPVAARLRVVRANEDTGHPPVETAWLIGPRLGRDFYLLAGGSRVVDPDDEFDGDSASGLAWEILWVPRELSAPGVEISVHGANGSDLEYTGASFGLRFGKLR